MNQHLLVKIPERRTRNAGPVQLGTPHRFVACRDAMIRHSGEGREQDAISFANLGKAHNTRFARGASLSLAGIFPTQLNDSELIRGSLGIEALSHRWNEPVPVFCCAQIILR
jgi:hypothetical protein